MKRIFALLLSALILGVFPRPAAADETPRVLGLVEIRGLESLAKAGSALSTAAGIPNTQESISLFLHSVLGATPGAGIPPESTVRILAFDNGTVRGGWAALLPVADEGAEYLAGLARKDWKNEAETADGILHFVAPAVVLEPWKEVYFLKCGATLVAAPTADDVRRAEAIRPHLPAILSAEGDLAIQIRPAALADVFGERFSAQLGQAFQPPGAPPEMAQLGRVYAEAYLAAAKQIDEFVLGLGVADGNLNLHVRVAPVPDSVFARWIATVQPPAEAANVVAVPDALAVEVLNLGDVQILLPAYMRFMEKMTAALPAGVDPAQLRTYLAAEKASYEQLAGDVGLALLPPTPESPLRLAQYAALKDGAAVRSLLPDLVRRSTDMMAAMAAGSDEELPFVVHLELGEPRDYRDVAIDRLTYALQIGGLMGALWPEAIPTKFGIELAWVPGGVLAVVGDPALTERLVDRALDGGAAPATARPGWQALYPEADARLVDTGHIAVFDVLRAYLGVLDAVTGGDNAPSAPDTPGHLATCSYVFDGLMTRIRFSLADIAAASAKVVAAQQARMSAGMEDSPADVPPAAVEIPAESGAPAAEPTVVAPEPATAETPSAPAQE